MLLKPHDVKGDKAHLASQGERESQVCKLSPASPAGAKTRSPCGVDRAEIPMMNKAFKGSPLTHPPLGSHCRYPAGTVTCFSLTKVENPNRLWRSSLQQNSPSQARRFGKSHPKEIIPHLLIYNY